MSFGPTELVEGLFRAGFEVSREGFPAVQAGAGRGLDVSKVVVPVCIIDAGQTSGLAPAIVTANQISSLFDANPAADVGVEIIATVTGIYDVIMHVSQDGTTPIGVNYGVQTPAGAFRWQGRAFTVSGDSFDERYSVFAQADDLIRVETQTASADAFRYTIIAIARNVD